MLCIVCACMIVACDNKEAEIEKMIVKDGTLNTTIFINERVDTSSVIVEVTYKDSTKKEVKSADLTFSAIDSSTKGKKQLTISYKDFSINVEINVLEPGTSDTVRKFSSGLIDEIKDNKSQKSTSGQKDNEWWTDFENRNKTHVTGDDNPLDLDIITEDIVRIDGVVKSLPVDANIVFTFKIWDETANDWKELLTETEDTAVKYATYIEGVTNTTVDFTEAAVGKKIMITAELAEGTKYDTAMLNSPSLTLETEVVDGYNVYNGKELSLFDNANEDNKWTAKKTEWGLNDIVTNNLILQRNITLQDSDLPAFNFYTREELYDGDNLKYEYNHGGTTYAEEHAIGSMKDDKGIYKRYLADDETFTVYGNYFDINAKDVTRCVYGVDKKDGRYWWVDDTNGSKSYLSSQATLFYYRGVQKNSEGNYDENVRNGELYASQGEGFMIDANFVGNSAKSASPIESGGLILCKADSVNFTTQNTLVKDFNIAWFNIRGMNFDGAKYTSDATLEEKIIAMEGNKEKNAHFYCLDNKIQNSYNSSFYFWGGPNVVIKNTSARKSGGPVILADHIGPGLIGHFGPNDSDYDDTKWIGGTPTNIDIINCDLESLVTGQEGWFATFGDLVTTLVQGIATTDGTFAGSNRTMLTKDAELKDNQDFLNMILIYKWGDKGVATDGSTRGYVRVFNTEEEYTNYYNTTDLEARKAITNGYDRTVDWSKGTTISFKNDNYKGSGVFAGVYNNTNALMAEQLPGLTKDGLPWVFENSKTGHGNLFNAGDAGCVNDADYVNLYMSNGFGTMFKMYDRKK